MRHPGSRDRHPAQHGIALIVVLLVLLVVLLLATASAQMAMQGERMARNDSDRRIAFEAAEAALLDAEMDIEDASDVTTSRSALFSRYSAVGFPSLSGTCESGAQNRFQGLCRPSAASDPAVWNTLDFGGGAGGAAVIYGHFTGRQFPSGGALPVKAPRYIIELLPDRRSGESAEREAYLYRITAIGYGSSERTQVALQSIYRKTR
ncbi:MAG TPA: pilus assembly protein [Oxalicibacterium sp.]|nr:pilus assembly protein [Oxalicibacterium sp.]